MGGIRIPQALISIFRMQKLEQLWKVLPIRLLNTGVSGIKSLKEIYSKAKLRNKGIVDYS